MVNKQILIIGTQIYPNNDKYEGAWKNGKPDGEGKFYYHNSCRCT